MATIARGAAYPRSRDSYRHPDRNADCYAYLNPDSHTNSDADSYTHGYTDRNTYANPNARAGPTASVGIGSARIGGTRQASPPRKG